MDDLLYEEMDIIEFNNSEIGWEMENIQKKIISEISLKIIVNGEELVSLLCMNQLQEELAIGFLYNEGVINLYEDIKDIYYNERSIAVVIELKEGLIIERQESLRSITSGCGKCFTYINPLKKNKFKPLQYENKFSIKEITSTMNSFLGQSALFKNVGGVHSVLLQNQDFKILVEDIGRHNCFDKIVGVLLKNKNINIVKNSVVFVSGRISSEIMMKIIRMGVPVLVSRSTPTTASIRLANEFKVTLLGYVRGERGFIYTFSNRIII